MNPKFVEEILAFTYPTKKLDELYFLKLSKK